MLSFLSRHSFNVHSQNGMKIKLNSKVKRLLIALVIAALILAGGIYYHVCTWCGCL